MAFPDGIVDAIDPARLRLLVEVGRQGSISAAADACQIGQPSATKHLKTLEAAVGAKLVEREGRSSRLTEAGGGGAGPGGRVLRPQTGRVRWWRATACACSTRSRRCARTCGR